jgi:HD superfamily phosphohydrolase YqeK
MAISEYTRLDSTAFAHKVSRKIAGWYSNTTFHENAVKRIVLQREEIYSLFEKVGAINVGRLLRYLDSSGFFYRPSSANRHHNFPGGLAEHSLGTFRIIEEWNCMTPDERQNSELYKRFLYNKQVTCDILKEKMNYDDMVVAAICHDLCKAKHYYMVGRVIKSHNSDPEPRHIHAALSVKRLKENGISYRNNEEMFVAVLLHMHLFSQPKSASFGDLQRKGRSSMLTIAVWAADKLDASRHPAGTRHRQF